MPGSRLGPSHRGPPRAAPPPSAAARSCPPAAARGAAGSSPAGGRPGSAPGAPAPRCPSAASPSQWLPVGWGGVGATRRGTWARMTAGMFICNPSRFHTTNHPIMTLYHRIMTVITHKSGTQNAQKRLNPIVHSGGSHWTLGGKVEMETFSFETQNLSLQFIFDLLV